METRKYPSYSLAELESFVAEGRGNEVMEREIAARAVIDEALNCKKTGEPKVLFFNLSGHGHFDMASYDKYLAGKLEDYDYPEAEINAALDRLPKIG